MKIYIFNPLNFLLTFQQFLFKSFLVVVLFPISAPNKCRVYIYIYIYIYMCVCVCVCVRVRVRLRLRVHQSLCAV